MVSLQECKAVSHTQSKIPCIFESANPWFTSFTSPWLLKPSTSASQKALFWASVPVWRTLASRILIDMMRSMIEQDYATFSLIVVLLYGHFMLSLASSLEKVVM